MWHCALSLSLENREGELTAVAEDENPPETGETPEHPAEEVQEHDAAAPDTSEPQARIESLEVEVESLKDQALRAQAEAENVRRRSAREVENAHKFALEGFVAQLLPVMDSLEKAVQSATDLKDASDGPLEGLEGLAQGVELSFKLFHEALARVGSVEVDPEGIPFDPELHEAMSVMENDEVEPGTILQVLQKGFTLHGRVVRAAKVIVAKAANRKVDEGTLGG